MVETVGRIFVTDQDLPILFWQAEPVSGMHKVVLKFMEDDPGVLLFYAADADAMRPIWDKLHMVALAFGPSVVRGGAPEGNAESIIKVVLGGPG